MTSEGGLRPPSEPPPRNRIARAEPALEAEPVLLEFRHHLVGEEA